MSFGTSETYIYAYIVFAAVYLFASVAFFGSAIRVSTGLSRSRSVSGTVDPDDTRIATEVVTHSQKLIDYTQLSTLLPLIYIVGSLFLGSIITKTVEMARPVNIAWVLLTGGCALASIIFTFLGMRESSRIGSATDIPDPLPDPIPSALQRLGLRMGVSATLLLLVAVFMVLNLWSIMDSIDVLPAVDFLL
jgi:hypothetical protein